MVAFPRARPGTASPRASSPRTAPPTPSRRHSGPTPTSLGPNLVKSYLRNHITKTVRKISHLPQQAPYQSILSKTDSQVCAYQSLFRTPQSGEGFHCVQTSGGKSATTPTLWRRFFKESHCPFRTDHHSSQNRSSLSGPTIVMPRSSSTSKRCCARMQWRGPLSPRTAITATCFWSPRRTEKCP